MRVALVVHGYPPDVVGGTERYVAAVAQELVARAHHVEVFAGTLQWRPALEVTQGVESGVRVTRVHRDDLYFDRWDKGYHPGVSAAFSRFLEGARPDVVHVHHWIRLSTDLVATAAAAGVPAVVTSHDLYPTCPRVFRLIGDDGTDACERPMGVETCLNCVPRWRFQKDGEVASNIASYRNDMLEELRLARCVVAPTEGHGAFLREMLQAPEVPVRVIPHGTLCPDLRPANPGPGDDPVHVCYWSHLHPLKGAHVLLEAVARCRHRDRVRVHLYGDAVDDDYRERLGRMAAGLDVEFHGRFQPDDLAAATIDIAVLPTLCRESYSFILDEAARLGAPILASDAGALRDRATSRVELFRRNDPDDLARRLDAFVGDPERRRTMRSATAPALLEFGSHVDALVEAYGAAVAAGPPAREAAAAHAGRLAEQWRRREAAFQELVRIERWEDVVAEQRQRIEALEARLRELES